MNVGYFARIRFVENADRTGMPGERLQSCRAKELRGFFGHHRDNIVSGLDQPACQIRGLIGRDTAETPRTTVGIISGLYHRPAGWLSEGIPVSPKGLCVNFSVWRNIHN